MAGFQPTLYGRFWVSPEARCDRTDQEHPESDARMTLEQFAKAADLSSLSEVDRVCFLAYFYLKTKSVGRFNAAQAAQWLISMRFAAPNQTGLTTRLRESDKTMRAEGSFTLPNKFVADMDGQIPHLLEKSQDIIDEGTILPPVDYEKTHGCAVLMRRLVEILLSLLIVNSISRAPSKPLRIIT